jgi:predicted nuclease with RNAse H fold
MKIVGIDLSGPANTAETALAWFRVDGPGLIHEGSKVGATDQQIFDLVSNLAGDLVFGLDAPLSYNPGGGDRPADQDLRRRLIDAGLVPGPVIPPTQTRMAYLTLRGISVARFLTASNPNTRIVEVHPAGCLILRGADLQDVKEMKRELAARQNLLAWLDDQGLAGAAQLDPETSHLVAACASALAAWKWATNRSVWITPASFPFHPFDFAC